MNFNISLGTSQHTHPPARMRLAQSQLITVPHRRRGGKEGEYLDGTFQRRRDIKVQMYSDTDGYVSWGYSSFRIKLEEAKDTDSPTAAPTTSPTSSPTSDPTDS